MGSPPGPGLRAGPIVYTQGNTGGVEGQQGEAFFLAPGPAPVGMKDVQIFCLVLLFLFSN